MDKAWARYPDHSRLLEYRNAQDVHSVKTVADWEIRRQHILLGMQEVMGDLPSKKVPLEMRTLESTETVAYLRYKISFVSEPGDRVPAYLLVPHMLQKPVPAILCLHQTTRVGKGQPAGLGDRPSLHYAHELAQRGYVCLAPDYPSFGEYPHDFAKSSYKSGSMKAIWNNIRAVDLLQTLPDVLADRLGCMGHSLGGHNTMFTAVFEPRLKAMVSCCGFTAFGKYMGGDLRGWSSSTYMPKIPSYGGWQKMPFDFHEVVAAFAPRPFLAVAPERDDNFDVGGVREVMGAAKEIYHLFGVAERLVARYPNVGHDFPEGDRLAAYAFFDQWWRDRPMKK